MFSRLLLTFAFLAVPVVAQEDGQTFEFHGTTLGGRSFTQDTYANNVVIIDLWGTWCPPCRKAVPVLVEMYQKYKQHGLEIVGYCYDRTGAAENVDKVREFAIKHKITYALAPGDVTIRKSIDGFSGYPTLLMIKDGKIEHTHVGFDDQAAESIEKWVREALELDAPDEGGTAAAANEEETKVVVPDGKIYEPGNGDTDFELEAMSVTADGSNEDEVEFESLRGKPVLLAMTSSWDGQAARTAAYLTSLQQVEGLEVVAWHLERVSGDDGKRTAIRAFMNEQSVDYRVIMTQLKVSREKVHGFAAVPTLLLFDAKGVLVQRENGISTEIEARVRKAATELVKAQ